MNAQSKDGQLAATVLDEYMKGFQERNHTLRVFSAHLHMDEATPHLHIDFVPFIAGSKRGLETRVSLKQALGTLGFTGGTRRDTEWNQWIASEKDQLATVMSRYDIEWEKKGTHEKHLSVLDFEKQERSKEVAALEQTLAKVQQQEVAVQAVEQIEAKPVPLTSKVVLEKGDYQTLVKAAQKYVVQEKRESELKKLLKAAKQTIKELKARLATVLEELAQYKSVRGQLKESGLEKENGKLKQENAFYRAIIEKQGLAHLLNGKKPINKQQRNPLANPLDR